MKILLVSTPAILTPPEAYGGMERIVHWLAGALGTLGHEVQVLAKTGSGTSFLAGEGDSEQEFVEIAKKMEFDIIIDFSHDKLVARSFPDKPQVCTYQVMTVGWPRNTVFISKAQRQHCERPEAPVIYYGLNVEEYPFYGGHRENYLLYMGSLIQEKRVHWVAQLGQRLSLPVKIAGPAWQEEYWPTLEKIKQWDGVEFVGDVGGAEKLELLQKARALVHPVGGANWVEAGAIIVLEALMVGTPVIASTNGCLPEYIVDFHNGFVCSSLDEMSDCTHWLSKVEPQACRESVVHYYNKERMARDYAGLAQEVLGGKTW